MAKIINICGLDGAGKSSQIKLISEHYTNQGLKCKNLHFPMYGNNQFSELISMFLKGNFGENDKVDPWFVANIYAMDRFKFLPELQKLMDEYDIIILDRYVYCNIAFQCAKINDDVEKEKLKQWILNFEFNFLHLPTPNITLFLDVPILEIEKRLNIERVGDDRNYLDGKKDIHEQDINFQKKVREIYFDIETDVENYHLINTMDEKTNKLYNIDELFNSYKFLL